MMIYSTINFKSNKLYRIYHVGVDHSQSRIGFLINRKQFKYEELEWVSLSGGERGGDAEVTSVWSALWSAWANRLWHLIHYPGRAGTEVPWHRCRPRRRARHCHGSPAAVTWMSRTTGFNSISLRWRSELSGAHPKKNISISRGTKKQTQSLQSYNSAVSTEALCCTMKHLGILEAR